MPLKNKNKYINKSNIFQTFCNISLKRTLLAEREIDPVVFLRMLLGWLMAHHPDQDHPQNHQKTAQILSHVRVVCEILLATILTIPVLQDSSSLFFLEYYAVHSFRHF